MNSSISGVELVDLKNRVVENFSPSNWRELGALTDLMDEVDHHPRLLRSLSFGDDDYDGLALTFLKRMIGQNNQNLNTVKAYINKVCPEVGQYISSAPSQERKIIFSPSIFQVPEESPDSNLISVMMPFGLELKPVYEAIKEAARLSGFKCQRADDIWDHSTIIQDVFSLIYRSSIVVCDFTGKNPNVFYEAGIAHTLGKHVVPITQSDQDIPFDLKHHRFAKYLNNGEGLKSLTSTLASKFSGLSGRPTWL